MYSPDRTYRRLLRLTPEERMAWLLTRPDLYPDKWPTYFPEEVAGLWDAARDGGAALEQVCWTDYRLLTYAYHAPPCMPHYPDPSCRPHVRDAERRRADCADWYRRLIPHLTPPCLRCTPTTVCREHRRARFSDTGHIRPWYRRWAVRLVVRLLTH